MVEAAGIEPAWAWYPCGLPTRRDQIATTRSQCNPGEFGSRAGNRTRVRRGGVSARCDRRGKGTLRASRVPNCGERQNLLGKDIASLLGRASPRVARSGAVSNA